MSKPQIGKPISPVKAELDRLELVERVPVLWRENSQVDENRNLVLPRHPLVIAYVNECAALPRPDANLRTARRNYETALSDYKDRRGFRVTRGIRWDDDGAEWVSLSAIIEVRAEAQYWHKVIVRLETEKKMKEQQERDRRSTNRHRLRRMGLAS
jgi:hypothetical protein